MSWFRVDDGLPDHPKLETLEDDPIEHALAVAAWTLLGADCCRRVTDGVVTHRRLARVLPWPEKMRARAASALIRSGMWEAIDDGFRFHDWSDYQPSKAERKEDRRAATERQKRWRAARRRGKEAAVDAAVDASTEPPVTALRDVTRDTPRDGPPSRPVPSPLQEKRSPSVTRDPMEPLALRPDVQRLHEAFKLALHQPHHKFRGAYSAEARTLADAIETYGLDDCLIVAEHALNDGWVNGKLDDKGAKHNTIGYVFGNEAAFNRILHAAKEHLGQSSRQRSAAELVAEAQKL